MSILCLFFNKSKKFINKSYDPSKIWLFATAIQLTLSLIKLFMASSLSLLIKKALSFSCTEKKVSKLIIL